MLITAECACKQSTTFPTSPGPQMSRQIMKAFKGPLGTFLPLTIEPLLSVSHVHTAPGSFTFDPSPDFASWTSSFLPAEVFAFHPCCGQSFEMTLLVLTQEVLLLPSTSSFLPSLQEAHTTPGQQNHDVYCTPPVRHTQITSVVFLVIAPCLYGDSSSPPCFSLCT